VRCLPAMACPRPRRTAAATALALSCIAAGALAAAAPAQFPYREDVARHMASLAQAAYCGPMKAMRHWACQPCIESGTQLARGTWRFVHSELHRDRNHTFVSLGRLEGPEPLSNSCFLSARGTERLSNFETDAECLPVPLPLDWDCPGCLVAGGFLEDFVGVEEKVKFLLDEIGCGPGSGRPVYVVGHSMGGAVASLAAYALRVKYGFDLGGVYTFEAPRVGNAFFAEAFEARIVDEAPAFRITVDRDPIVHLPPAIFGFQHARGEVFYSKSGGYKVCDGAEDPECSAQYANMWHWMISEHCRVPLTPSGSICECNGWVPLSQAPAPQLHTPKEGIVVV